MTASQKSLVNVRRDSEDVKRSYVSPSMDSLHSLSMSGSESDEDQGQNQGSSSCFSEGENTPLFQKTQRYDVELGASRSDRQPSIQLGDYTGSSNGARSNNESKRSSRFSTIGWKKVKNKMEQGDLLLHSEINGIRQEGSNDNGDDNRDSVDNKQAAQDMISSAMDFSIGQCLCAIALYMLIAVIAFSFVFDHWTIIDSMYFSVVTFTTIGYGDITPDTTAGRLFTCMFAFTGVAILGLCLGVIGNSVIEAQNAALKQTSELSKYQVMNLFKNDVVEEAKAAEEIDVKHYVNDHGDDIRELQTTLSDGDSVDDHHTYKIKAERTKAESFYNKAAIHICGIIFIILIFAVSVADDAGISSKRHPGDALYFALVTATTIGYGDFAPKSQMGRLLAVFFIPLATGTMGNFLSTIAGYVVELKQAAVRRELGAREMTLQDLSIMDDNNDGEVSYSEFLEFMLVSMNKVDKKLLNELKDQFDRLDEDGTGSLSRGDLIAAARRKLSSPQRKLELAAYKEKLMEQAEQGRRNNRFGSINTSIRNSLFSAFQSGRQSTMNSPQSPQGLCAL